VITGNIPGLTREAAKDLAIQAGARPTSSVSSRTDYLVVGDAPGSKVAKAESLGVPIWSADRYLGVLRTLKLLSDAEE
jgi:DNA ligase (NAD+)